MRIGFPHRYARAATAVAIVTGTLPGAPAIASAAPTADMSRPFYDRSFVLAANQKCRLFAPVVASALTASTLQARGAAARAGISDLALYETAARARERAGQTACADPELAIVRNRVASAFSGWSRIARMTFPGQRGDWVANRSTFSTPTWRLMQTTRTGASPVTFGFSAGGGQAERLEAVVSFVGRSRPYAARIVMRNVDQSPRAWLTATGGGALPPEVSRRAFFAARSLAAEPTLLSPQQTQGQTWVFSPAAADALSALDPREPFVVEFLFRDDSVARATFEAGDFAAGRAFIGMGSL